MFRDNTIGSCWAPFLDHAWNSSVYCQQWCAMARGISMNRSSNKLGDRQRRLWFLKRPALTPGTLHGCCPILRSTMVDYGLWMFMVDILMDVTGFMIRLTPLRRDTTLWNHLITFFEWFPPWHSMWHSLTFYLTSILTFSLGHSIKQSIWHSACHLHAQLGSLNAHWDLAFAVPTEIRSLQLRPGSAHWDPELSVARSGEEGGEGSNWDKI